MNTRERISTAVRYAAYRAVGLLAATLPSAAASNDVVWALLQPLLERVIVERRARDRKMRELRRLVRAERFLELRRRERASAMWAAAPVPPLENDHTRRMNERLKVGDRVRLTNGYLVTVLAAPYDIDGWKMVQVSPRHEPRSPEDPSFLVVSLIQIDEILSDAMHPSVSDAGDS